ncbi:hypothetical protein AB1Y20_001359 [Prymnesium parvum]|uniref:Leucine-rich repeat domain-containing protein n=1 Tax=Prymnesium parvum TaxID=97485 RepID=A0AB34KAU7_PRYPA
MGLVWVELPEGLRGLGHGAFRRCGALTSVALPSTLARCGELIFSYCHELTSIARPEGVSLGPNAFYGCTRLAAIGRDAVDAVLRAAARRNPASEAYDAMRAAWYAGVPIQYTLIRRDGDPDYEDDSEGQIMARWEFARALTRAGADVRLAVERRLLWVEVVALCDEAAAVTREATRARGGRATIAIEARPLDETPALGVDGEFAPPASLSELSYADAFRGCTALRSVVLPQGCRVLGDGAFSDCARLTAITLPSSIETIGAGAFARGAARVSLKAPRRVIALLGAARRARPTTPVVAPSAHGADAMER